MSTTAAKYLDKESGMTVGAELEFFDIFGNAQDAKDFEDIVRVPKAQRTDAQLERQGDLMLRARSRGKDEELNSRMASRVPVTATGPVVTPAQNIIPKDSLSIAAPQSSTAVVPSSSSVPEEEVSILGHGSRIPVPGSPSQRIESFPGAQESYASPEAGAKRWKEEAYSTLRANYGGDIDKLRSQIASGGQPAFLENEPGRRQRDLYTTVRDIEYAQSPEELGQALSQLSEQGNQIAGRLSTKVAQKLWYQDPSAEPREPEITEALFPNFSARRKTKQGATSQFMGGLWDVVGAVGRAPAAGIEHLAARDDLSYMQRLGTPDPYLTSPRRLAEFTMGSAISGPAVRGLAGVVGGAVSPLTRAAVEGIGRSKGMESLYSKSKVLGDVLGQALPTENLARATTYGKAGREAMRFADEGVSLFPSVGRQLAPGAEMSTALSLPAQLAQSALSTVPSSLAYGAVPTAFLATENPDLAREGEVTSSVVGGLAVPAALGAGARLAGAGLNALAGRVDNKNLTRLGQELTAGPSATQARLENAYRIMPPSQSIEDVALFDRVIRPAVQEARRSVVGESREKAAEVGSRTRKPISIAGTEIVTSVAPIGGARRFAEMADEMFALNPGQLNPVARGKGADREYTKLMNQLQEIPSGDAPGLIKFRNDIIEYLTSKGAHKKAPAAYSELDGAKQFLDNLQGQLSPVLREVSEGIAREMKEVVNASGVAAALEGGTFRSAVEKATERVAATEATRLQAIKDLSDQRTWQRLLNVDRALPDPGKEELLFRTIAQARLTPLTRSREFVESVANLNELVDLLNKALPGKKAFLQKARETADASLQKRIDKALKTNEWQFEDLDYITSSIGRGLRDNMRKNVASRTPEARKTFNEAFNDSRVRALAGSAERGLWAAGFSLLDAASRAVPKAIGRGLATSGGPSFFRTDESGLEMPVFGDN